MTRHIHASRKYTKKKCEKVVFLAVVFEFQPENGSLNAFCSIDVISLDVITLYQETVSMGIRDCFKPWVKYIKVSQYLASYFLFILV